MALSDRYSSVLDKCVRSLTTWKHFIRDNLEDPDHEIHTAKLQEITKEYCIMDFNHQNTEKAIKLMDEAVSADSSRDHNIDALYQAKLSEQDTNDSTEHEIWKQLFCHEVSIQEVRPKKKKDRGQYEEVDDSLLCSNAFTAPIDPISKVVIRKPIKNIKCRHVYDSESIYDYIRQSRKKAKCPYMGCNNNTLRPEDLQEDRQLEEQISQYLESHQNENNSDYDDSD